MARSLKGRCGSCRQWSTMDTLWGTCGRAWGEDGEAADKKSLAYAEDGESYRATLKTRANFGCVQYEERMK